MDTISMIVNLRQLKNTELYFDGATLDPSPWRDFCAFAERPEIGHDKSVFYPKCR